MTHSVRIPADVDREDRILAGFTARQVAVMAVTGLVLYGGWLATRAFLPVIAYLALAIPVGVAVTALVVLRRDGMSMDRLLIAAIRQRLQPRRRVAPGQHPQAVPGWLAEAAGTTDEAAPGELHLPATEVGEAGVIDLGAEGVALVAACSTVTFGLRTPAEQEALTAASVPAQPQRGSPDSRAGPEPGSLRPDRRSTGEGDESAASRVGRGRARSRRLPRTPRRARRAPPSTDPARPA